MINRPPLLRRVAAATAMIATLCGWAGVELAHNHEHEAAGGHIHADESRTLTGPVFDSADPESEHPHVTLVATREGNSTRLLDSPATTAPIPAVALAEETGRVLWSREPPQPRSRASPRTPPSRGPPSLLS